MTPLHWLLFPFILLGVWAWLPSKTFAQALWWSLVAAWDELCYWTGLSRLASWSSRLWRR